MNLDGILEPEALEALEFFIPDLRLNPLPEHIVMEMRDAAERARDFRFASPSCPRMDMDCLAADRLEEEMCSMEICALPDSLDEDEATAERVLSELGEMNEETLRGIGLSEAAIQYILHLKVRPSRMRITRRSRIILEDYDNYEVRLDDKTKALYFLFLRHPEGIAIKQLPEHVNELMDLYQSISGRDDPEAMRRTITDLADPFQNFVNISLSRIKRAFGEPFCRQVAQNYYVTGERGRERRIALDRSLVTWEAIR